MLATALLALFDKADIVVERNELVLNDTVSEVSEVPEIQPSKESEKKHEEIKKEQSL